MDLVLSAAGPTLALLLVLLQTPARELGRATCVCAAFALGIGISSAVWWLLIQVPVRSAGTLLYIDTGLWAAVVLGLLVLNIRRSRSAHARDARREPIRLARRMTPGLAGALAILIPIGLLAATTFAATSFVQPHGEWDAWAIWNARARVLFFSLPTGEAPAIAHPLLAHADYPQLLPASVARAWTVGGIDSVGVPIGLAAMCAVCVVVVLGASVRHHTTPALGVLAAAFILASPRFGTWAVSQGADVPLSLYFLLTFVFASAAMNIERSGTRHTASLWMLAGLSAGLAAWTKNEGLAFVAVAALVPAVAGWRQRERGAWWVAPAAFVIGAAPVLLVLTTFKLSIEPANDIVSALTTDRLTTMFAWDRIAMILGSMSRELWFGGAPVIGMLPALGVFVVVRGIPGRASAMAWLALTAMGAMAILYAAVYLTTPHDLTWHLRTSLDRVLLQLLPPTVWAALLLAGESDPRLGITPTRS